MSLWDIDEAPEQRMLHRYMSMGERFRLQGLPPGLAKKAHLPPGLAKRDTLPPGLEKRELPRELKRRLPPPPVGTERVIVDNSVLLIEQGTQIVVYGH